MANRKMDYEKIHPEALAAQEIYNTAKQEAEIEIARMREEMAAVREESEAIGALKKISCDIAYNETLKYMILHRIKQSKDYRKGGLAWVEFCDAIGEPQRSVDRIIQEMKPVYEKFSANLADLSGYGLNKIRHLGKAISANLAEIEDGVIVFEGEKIPLAPEYKDDIEAILDRFKDALKEKEDEEKAQKKASDKVLKGLHAELSKAHKESDELKRKLEADAVLKGLDGYPEEMRDSLSFLFETHKAIEEFFINIRKTIPYDSSPEAVQRQLYYLLIYMSMRALDERVALSEHFDGAAPVEYEIREDEIPADLAGNLPLTKAVGAKMKEKIEARKGA